MYSDESGTCCIEGAGMDGPTGAQAPECRIRVKILSQLLGNTVANMPYKTVDLKKLDAQCTEYWRVVNDAVNRGLLSSEQQSRAFIGRLMSLGDNIRRTLMDAATATAVWTVAHNTSTLGFVIPDRLLHVPWEALFNAESGFRSFLADHTVIARFPENNECEFGMRANSPKFSRDRIVCLDCVLKPQLETQFQDEQHVFFPTNRMDLADHVQGTRLTHWICEHAERGLRFDADEFFTLEDTSAHRFPSGSVLMLTSCKSGSHSPDTAGIAAKICCFSDCTVIAPSSLIAVGAGVDFVKEINRAINSVSTDDKLSVANFWRRLSSARVASMGDASKPFQSSAWSALWYAIYGDVDRLLRGAT